VLRVGDLRNAIARDVMVGEDQAIGRDERAGTAPDSHRSEPQMVRKPVVDIYAVSLFQLALGKLIEKPHAFVGRGGQRQGTYQ
jgi:hypothetical protein